VWQKRGPCFLVRIANLVHHCLVASNQRDVVVTWWPGWDYFIESAKGWADPYIADAYLLFGRAGSHVWFIWFGIGCLVLLFVFEIIERNARRKKQRNVADATVSKQSHVGGRRRSNQPKTQFQTKKSRST
jgi:hypothetical protein